jgi:hypothetical protein
MNTEDLKIAHRGAARSQFKVSMVDYARTDKADARRMRGLEIARQKEFTPAERITVVEWQQYA